MTASASSIPFLARVGEASRVTRETEIRVKLGLDGAGASQIDTGVGFLDHMLDQLARHGAIDLDIHARGDLHIDAHHTVEDVGITMGRAFAEALGDAKGIKRWGFAYAPLDESLARAVVDVSGRGGVIWRVAFTRDSLGGMDTQLLEEWFRGFARTAGLTIHVEVLYGVNAHHQAEACFKAFAVALRAAVARDGARVEVPSTKGTLTKDS